MKTEEAQMLIKEIIPEYHTLQIESLTNLLLWAFDKGWEEGIEDFKEEQNRIQNLGFRKP